MEKPHGDPPTQLDSVHKNTDVTKMIFRGGPNTKTQKSVHQPAFFSVFFSVCFFSASFAFANTFSASDVLEASFFGVVLLLHESLPMAFLKKTPPKKQKITWNLKNCCFPKKGISKCLLFQGSSSIQR